MIAAGAPRISLSRALRARSRPLSTLYAGTKIPGTSLVSWHSPKTLTPSSTALRDQSKSSGHGAPDPGPTSDWPAVFGGSGGGKRRPAGLSGDPVLLVDTPVWIEVFKLRPHRASRGTGLFQKGNKKR